MPATYACDQCGQSGSLDTGWYIVQVIGYVMAENGVRNALLSPAVECYLHDEACWTAWREKMGIS